MLEQLLNLTVSNIAEPDETDPETRDILTTLKGISRARSYPTFLLYWWAYNFFKNADCNLDQRSSYISAYLGISTPFVEDTPYTRYYGTRPETIRDMLLRCGEVDLYRLTDEITAGHSKIWLFPFNTEVFNEEGNIISFSCYLMDIDKEFLEEIKNKKEEEHLRISSRLSQIFN